MILKESPSSESAYDIGVTFIPWLFHGLGKYLSEWMRWTLEEWNFLFT